MWWDNGRKFVENNWFSSRGIAALLVYPFADHAMHLQHVLAKLLERKAEREKPFRRFAFHVARQAFISHRAEFLDVIAERGLDGIQRWRRLLVPQRSSAGAEEIAPGRLKVFERRR
jgi:hypothetical protein